MARIFISHSSRNNAAAIALRDWIVRNGWDDSPFLDLDVSGGIAAGERWERSLHEAADRCEAVLFLISRDWLQSDWCLREFNLAQKLNKRLFGVLIEDLPASALPAALIGTWQVVNLAAGNDHILIRTETPDRSREEHVTFSRSGLARLKAGLDSAGLDASFFPWPPDNDPTRSPYPGLRPLEAADAGIFFGRNAPIVILLDQLRGLQEAASSQVFVILGASGAGKLIAQRAGLWPRLKRDALHFLPLPIVRPRGAVLSGDTGWIGCLHDAVKEGGRAVNRAEIEATVAKGASAVMPLLEQLIKAAQPTEATGRLGKPPAVVLSIDQGEELFLAEGASEAMAFRAAEGFGAGAWSGDHRVVHHSLRSRRRTADGHGSRRCAAGHLRPAADAARLLRKHHRRAGRTPAAIGAKARDRPPTHGGPVVGHGPGWRQGCAAATGLHARAPVSRVWQRRRLATGRVQEARWHGRGDRCRRERRIQGRRRRSHDTAQAGRAVGLAAPRADRRWHASIATRASLCGGCPDFRRLLQAEVLRNA